ncbi:MAG: GNAT family N-acetyltransferase [Negativicutes bacterium]
MVRKLSEPDNEKALQFLYADFDFNAMIIGDIINYGYESDTVDVWGDFSGADELIAVLLRYDNFLMISAQPDYNGLAFIPVIDSYLKFESISGKAEIIKPLATALHRKWLNKTYMRLKTLANAQPYTVTVELATANEVQSIDDLLVSVEFGFSHGEIVERYLRTVKRHEVRYFVIKQDGKVVACAATAAECADSAVIVSVCCRKEYRRRGYAEACMRELCTKLSSEGKQLYLFCENPVAKKMYEKLGFVTIGQWSMIETEEN